MFGVSSSIPWPSIARECTTLPTLLALKTYVPGWFRVMSAGSKLNSISFTSMVSRASSATSSTSLSTSSAAPQPNNQNPKKSKQAQPRAPNLSPISYLLLDFFSSKLRFSILILCPLNLGVSENRQCRKLSVSENTSSSRQPSE